MSAESTPMPVIEDEIEPENLEEAGVSRVLPFPTEQALREHPAAYFGAISRARTFHALDVTPHELTNPQYLKTLCDVGSSKGRHSDLGSLLAALPAESLLLLPNESIQKVLVVLEKYPDELYDFLGQLLVKIDHDKDQGASGRLSVLRSIGILTRLQVILDEWKIAAPEKYTYHKESLDEMASNNGILPFRSLWFN